MNVNEIIVQNPAILMERRREKECWRISKTYYRSFIAHLQHYFTPKAWPSVTEDVLSHIPYIDIGEKDFCMVSYLFAILKVSGDRIVVKGIFPQKYLPLWEEHIILNFCVEENGFERFVPLRFDMKMDKQKTTDY